MKRFERKAVVVTGAASGIGAACVRRLWEEGASVALADQDQSGIDKLVTELHDDVRIFDGKLDVSDAEQVQRFIAEAQQKLGKLHGLINCAGIKGVGSVLDCEYENWQKVMSVNLDGTFLMCQAFARAVRRRREPQRAIVNISSGCGHSRRPQPPALRRIRKSAISGITRTMGAESGPHGIRVNAIAPGIIRTPFTAYLFDDPEKVEAHSRRPCDRTRRRAGGNCSGCRVSVVR